MFPSIKCLNANSKNTTPNILLQHNKKKPKDNNELRGLSLSFATKKKPAQDDDELRGSLLCNLIKTSRRR
jgi:hypothetical protein